MKCQLYAPLVIKDTLVRPPIHHHRLVHMGGTLQQQAKHPVQNVQQASIVLRQTQPQWLVLTATTPLEVGPSVTVVLSDISVPTKTKSQCWLLSVNMQLRTK